MIVVTNRPLFRMFPLLFVHQGYESVRVSLSQLFHLNEQVFTLER